MKLLIAFAAVLSSAILTVPTVTDVGNGRSPDATQIAALTSSSASNSNG
jgi:hypothetical protein